MSGSIFAWRWSLQRQAVHYGGGRQGALILHLVGGVVLHQAEESARQVMQLLKQAIVNIAPINHIEAARLSQTPPRGPLRPMPGRARHIDRPLPQDGKRDMHLGDPMLVILPQGQAIRGQAGKRRPSTALNWACPVRVSRISQSPDVPSQLCQTLLSSGMKGITARRLHPIDSP